MKEKSKKESGKNEGNRMKVMKRERYSPREERKKRETERKRKDTDTVMNLIMTS